MAFRDRIKELRRVKAANLVPHPKNWRTHNDSQRAAIRGILSEIGYADALIARELPDGKLQVLDGHMRADISPRQKVPVLVVDLSDAEAEKFLLMADPLSAMAEADPAKLAELAAEVETQSEALRALIDSLSATVEDAEAEVAAGHGVAPLSTAAPPVLTWILIGIPTVRYGEVAELVERLATIPNIAFETANDDEPDDQPATD